MLLGSWRIAYLPHHGYLLFLQHGPDKHSNMPSDGTVHELTRNVRYIYCKVLCNPSVTKRYCLYCSFCLNSAKTFLNQMKKMNVGFFYHKTAEWQRTFRGTCYPSLVNFFLFMLFTLDTYFHGATPSLHWNSWKHVGHLARYGVRRSWKIIWHIWSCLLLKCIWHEIFFSVFS